jgi:hypothetical protein
MPKRDIEVKRGGKKRTPGRPKLQESDVRNQPVTVEFSENEIKELTRRCLATNTKLRPFIRTAACGYPLPRVIPQINREAWLSLIPLAGAFGRIVTLINAGRDVGISLDMALQLRQELVNLRRELRGG